jgi:hypothetical protein
VQCTMCTAHGPGTTTTTTFTTTTTTTATATTTTYVIIVLTKFAHLFKTNLTITVQTQDC